MSDKMREAFGKWWRDIGGGSVVELRNGAIISKSAAMDIWAAAKLSDIPYEFSISLDEVISCLENGFVRCETCGDQEDTKDLDVMSDLRKMRAMLAARPEVKL